MTFSEGVPLSPLTTFHIGGRARVFAEARTEEDVHTALGEAERRGLSLLPLGGGSNILVPDEGVSALVLRVAIPGIEFRESGALLVAGAGETWDAVVDAAAARGLFGIENLAGIPGSVGGAAVQNIGAYGVELKDVFAYADVIDRGTGDVRRIKKEDAEFAYRSSIFARSRNYLITRVALRLSHEAKPNLSYADLAHAKESGTALTMPAEIVRAVREIRSRKFPGPHEGGTAGSFFKNPVIPNAKAQSLSGRFPGLPAFPQENGEVKVSLAWLLDHALHLKGYRRGPVRLYEKQPLVLVGEPGARAQDVEALAHFVFERVREELGIAIEREVETFGAGA